MEEVKTGRFTDKIGTYTRSEGGKSNENKHLSMLPKGENGNNYDFR